MKRKLIKFDVIHPADWLASQKAGRPDIARMGLAEYRAWLNGLRSNYSDYYTHWLNESGEWLAEEYYLLDPDFTDKVARHLFGTVRAAYLRRRQQVLSRVMRRHLSYRDYVLRAYLREFAPDVVFVRSQPRPSAFWRRVYPGALHVARLSARLPNRWHPNDFDLIYTDQPDFKTFFELHGTPTILNKQGFDERLLTETTDNPRPKGVVFVGGLGTQNFRQRTEFLAELATDVPFDWYGYWWAYGGDGRTLADFPALRAAYRGPTSGLAMYQLYRDAAVCLNDYVDTANGIGYNQRMFEVMGIGGFLLTRQAPNFTADFPEGVFATYTDAADCRRQIAYYLDHPDERRAIAERGRAFVAEHFGYRQIANDFGQDLDRMLAERAQR